MPMLILTVMIVISAALTISAEYHGTQRIVYLCKPLTTVCLILLALLPKYPVAPFYRYMIVAGLVCSLAGDVFLMLPADKFIQGLISFLVAHLCYIAAFVWMGARVPAHVWAGLPLLFYGGLMLWLLWPSLGKMKAPVIVYMLVILLMGWTALSSYFETKQSGSVLAAFGAFLFIASDSLLAVNRFRVKFRLAQLLILATYFTAQWLIALST
jgi:uncharacterized membrane protein YhhN